MTAETDKKKNVNFALLMGGIFDFVLGSFFLMASDTADEFLGLGQDMNTILGYALLAAGAISLVLALTVFKPKRSL